MQNVNDGTIIVPNEEIQLIIKANNLPDDLGSKIQEHFSGPFSQLAEWQAKADSIVIVSEDQTDDIALANDGRKTLMKIRTTIEKVRKELKDPYFRMGQTIDAVAKALTAKIEPIESDLKAKSDYAVNLAAARKATLVAARKAALLEVGHNGEIPGLGEMSEETFEMILGGAKEKVRLAREQEEREAAERAAADEAERVATERAANAEKVLNARIMRLMEVQAKRGNDPDPYLFNGDMRIAIHTLREMEDQAFESLFGEFQAEADRLYQAEKDRLALVQRTNDRKVQLVTLGARENVNQYQTNYHLGEVIVEVESINQADESEWNFIVDQLVQEANRLAQIEKQRLAANEIMIFRQRALVSLGAKTVFDSQVELLVLAKARAVVESLGHMEDAQWTACYDVFQAEKQNLDKIEEENRKAQQERLQTANDRLAQLREVGYATTFADVADLTDLEFTTLLQVKTNEFNAAKERQRITNLGLMRKPLLDAQGEYRDAEFLGSLTNDEFQSMLENATRLKRLADEEAAQAKINADAKAEAIRKDKETREAEKAAALAPDKIKLQTVLSALEGIQYPECTTIVGEATMKGAQARIKGLIDEMKQVISEMK